jgi:hypothetical protein
MRYGRNYEPLLASQVETPLVGVNTFLNAQTNTLYAKYPNGESRPADGRAIGPFEAQAVNTGDENDLVFSVTGVTAYTAGDTYYFYCTETNTDDMSLRINSLSARPINYLGATDSELPAGTIQANTVNAFIFVDGRFEWIGQVQGSSVVWKASPLYSIFVSEDTEETITILNLPPKSQIELATGCAIVDFSGTKNTTAAITNFAHANITGLQIFSEAFSVFTGAVAAKTGMMVGPVTSSTSKIVSQTTINPYAIVFEVDDDISAVSAGQLQLTVRWTINDL